MLQILAFNPSQLEERVPSGPLSAYGGCIVKWSGTRRCPRYGGTDQDPPDMPLRKPAGASFHFRQATSVRRGGTITNTEGMMNASAEVSRLLEQSGAVLVRHKKHLVYQLPNGRMFTRYKSPSDHRAPLNELSDLRRALATDRPTAPYSTHKPPAQGAEICAREHNSMPATQNAAQAPPPPAAGSAQAMPRVSLKERIETAIREEETAQEKLLAEAQTVERRLCMLKALLPFAEEPAAEAALKAIVSEPAMPPEPTRPEPPQEITERVQITRQLVLAATQTFDDTFTVNDVMALMTGGRKIDGQERLRVRSSIAQSMMTLYERGELVRESEGYGKRQAVWRKAVLCGSGHGVGTRA